MEPAREPPHRCPACRDVLLRPFRGRLACDACEGLFLTPPDLIEAICDLTGQQVVLGFLEERPSQRACPRCRAAMIACHLRVVIDKHTPRLRSELDRCPADGIWFDAEELATTLAKLRHVVSAGGTGGTGRGGARGGGGVVAINGRGWGSGWPL
jgi:Zn-finger nucleic acid-binding protein